MLVVVSTACGCEAVFAVFAVRPAKQTARRAGGQRTSTLKQCCLMLLRRLASRCGGDTCWQLMCSLIVPMRR